jgi:hypothetical protein
MRRRWVWILGGVLAVALLVLVGGAFVMTRPAAAMPEAEAALESGGGVTVSTDPWLTFTPDEPSDSGVILYPGGLVEAKAYAPAARAIAEAGHLAVIVPMPFNLAVLAPDSADAVVAAHPEVGTWVIGGHSLGGAMAAQYADGHPDVIDGLVLWGAYPPDGTDLSDADLAVTSVYASEDGLSTVAEVEASAARLPADSRFVLIEGGNHAGFGWYGPQNGDGEATISREEQQDQTVAATLELLETLAPAG